ncbi:hypothetical protein AALP_AA7G060300 [Arabis alpina]|uniref:Uncharacterized protein n=1 Tax=Arabis alpina TaxID=50452 RepID=A0A087GG81_ARAAL|nr:hypothetical protein AALP_AA7G060300 [Arabis alpina]
MGTSLVSALPCISTSLFTPNSTYDTNRRSILTSLPANVTSHYGFYNGAIGQSPNKIYAAGMCIPGIEEEACAGCILSVSNLVKETCLQEKRAIAWIVNRTICMVRYSDTSFLGSLELEHREFHSLNGFKTNQTEFSRVWSGLTQRMIEEASSSTDATWSAAKYYAADVAALPDSQTLYALMQCTPDLSPAQCNLCLKESVGNYQECCLGRQGGIILRQSCVFKAELYPFGGAFTVMTARPLQPPPYLTKKYSRKLSLGIIAAIAVPIVVIFIIFLVLLACLFARRRKSYPEIDFDQSGITFVNSLQFDFQTIEVATDKFARSNKLGQGGFGEVYKGALVDGRQVAVKRLSKTSEQGAQEFKNEVVLVEKLQHRNLVKLLGFCLEGEEKILVYEFVANKSLDYFLFDSTKQRQLDWRTRYNIIGGITRGILYLHQDSRLTIIHRDLKASNILLDANMNPKIADFGMARISGIDQSVANTKRIAGTFGYMPPEYVIQGQFSMKSDVYSFGVLVLEIICGKKNSSFYKVDTTAENLVTYAWRLWRNGLPLELLDQTIAENCQSEEVIRCIHIALLCVQKDPKDRPNLSTIMLMLTSNSLILPVPQPPGFFLQDNKYGDGSTLSFCSQTINDVTMTNMDPR